VKEKITGPYSLPNTSIQLSAEQQKRLMQGYNDAGDATPYWHLGGFGAAGGLHSSSREMLAYLNYNRLETEPALRLPHSTTFKSERENVAFAWFIKQTKEGNVLYWHNGGTFGFSSFCGFVKEKGISLVVLANSATNVDYIAIAILNYLQQ
jgi:CubicO group peptidase (beta-lactamase class C family)